MLDKVLSFHNPPITDKPLGGGGGDGGGGGGARGGVKRGSMAYLNVFLFSSSSVSVDILDYLYHVYGRTLTAQLEAEASTSSNDAS